MSQLFPVIPLLFGISLLLMGDRYILAADEPKSLHVRIEEDGVAVIQAQIKLPAPPDLVFTVLTDYTNWPLLFPDGVTTQVERLADHVVVTEMTIPHKIFFSKTRLKAESTETPPHKLETKLIEGDYLQYDQVWRLTPIQEGKYTRAELNLTVQPNGWIIKLVPALLYRWGLTVDLQEHFEKLRRQVLVKKREEN